MAMDSSEYNASGDAPKAELEAIKGVEFGSEKDLAKSDGIASTEREINDQDEIGGPYVIINGDSGNHSEKNLKLDDKADPETINEGKVSPIPLMNSSKGIGGTEFEGEAELEARSDPGEEEPLLEGSSTVGSELGEKLAEESKKSTDNEELSDNRENSLEVRGTPEKLSEEIVSKESSQDKDQELCGTGENKRLIAEPVVEEVSHEEGQECDSRVVGEFDSREDANLEMHKSETICEEDDGSKLVFESGEKEEECAVSAFIEGASCENGRVNVSERVVGEEDQNRRMNVSETVVGEQDQHEELDTRSTVAEQAPQEFEEEVTIVPSMQVMHEKSGELSDCLDVQKETELPVSVLGDTTSNLAVEAESEQNHEVQSEESLPLQEEVTHKESQDASDSLQTNEEVEMPEPESKEQSLLDSTVGVDSEQKHEVQQAGSNPSQEHDQHELSEGVSDSRQSNESAALGIELNNQSPLDSAVKVESQQKPEEQQEASILSQQEEMHQERKEVKVPSDGKNESRDTPETELKDTPLISDIETESNVLNGSVSKIEAQDIVSTSCNGVGNGELETSTSPILFEKEMDAPSSTNLDQEKLAESETKQEITALEANGESEAPTTDTVADEEALSEYSKDIEDRQNSEKSDAEAVSASHDSEIDSRSVNENELVDSSSEVLADSEIKSTIEVEEGNKSMAEFEDGQSKTEAETVSMSSIDASVREIGLEDSVQIGKFKISIAENGPPVLQQELQESTVTTEAVAPDEPGTSTSNGEKSEVQPSKWQQIYIMKVPRYSDEVQWEKIQEAQARLDDLTRARDVIRDMMQNRRKVCANFWDEVQKAREEERAARAVFNAKRHEISTVQSVINKLNKANSIDDMDDLIDMKEKSLQHETMTLKQEKMLIQEIKELKAQRKKLIDNMGSAAEIDEAFDQKDSVFDKLKTLKTELEVLGKTLAKAEAKTKAAQKEYENMDLSFCSLQEEYKSADEVRQNAYFYWRDLKTELVKKNKYFFNYRDDSKIANNFAHQTPPNKEGARLFCSKQVDKLMDLWNRDAEFRKQYVNSNKASTLRRLKTLDGRALGPDEVPPVIPTATVTYRRTSTPLLPATKEVKLEKSARASSPTFIQSDEFPELPLQKEKISHGNSKHNKFASSKEKSMDQPVVSGTVTIESAQIEKKQEEDEMERRKREEEERVRREEDIKRKAKAEAEEKERLREEQKAKAKEAEERKRRKAEKAQERAEFKARKEAEIRDKRKAKKEKKKAAGGESENGEATNSSPVESSMPSEIAENKDTTHAPTTATRRPARPQAVLKQLKRVEPVPIALRNRNRRKMRSWIIGIVTAIAALLTVFLIGNYVKFSDISSLIWM